MFTLGINPLEPVLHHIGSDEIGPGQRACVDLADILATRLRRLWRAL